MGGQGLRPKACGSGPFVSAPTLTGSADLAIKPGDAPRPFSRAVLTDTNYNSTDTLTITLSDGGRGGVLSGGGLSGGSGGIYTLQGSAADVTAALQALVFTPAQGTPNGTVTTAFTLNDRTAVNTSAVDAAFSVTATTQAVNPTLTGTAALTVQSEAPSSPFASATLTDPNANSTDALTIPLSNGGTGGVLLGAGLSDGAGGHYRCPAPGHR